MTSLRSRLLRDADGAHEVTNIELFFDLVYVFAVTQLAQFLGSHDTAGGAVQTAVLLAMVWQIWVYTTWAVNYLDPDRTVARAMLVVLMLGSLILAAGIPYAFDDRGWLVAITYVSMQCGRAIFLVAALRGDQLQMVFVRILPWTAVSSTVMLAGAAVEGHARELMWAASVAIDLVAAAFGFYFPGLGRSQTTDWTISGSHFAERCQAFVLIALGESIIVIGARFDVENLDGNTVLTFLTAFAGAVGLWWIYFDRAAADSAREIETSDDPGRLARNAFHWIHPVIVGGIIVEASAGERLFTGPSERGDTTFAWLLLGGIALFLGGHALFKAVVWRRVSWPRIGGIVAVAAFGLAAPHMSRLALAVGSVEVIVAVAIVDRLTHPGRLNSTRVDTAERTIAAPRDRVFAALIDKNALLAWLPPTGMTAAFERFDGRPGGSYRMILTHADPSAGRAKSTSAQDVVEARFVEISPDERVVQEVDFVSDDPSYGATMTMTWSLERVEGGTQVTVRAENVPEGISATEHVTGMTSSLDNLAGYVEGRRDQPTASR